MNFFGSYVNLLETYELESGNFKEGLQINANYLYNILPNLKTGVEFIYGNSTNLAGTSGNDASCANAVIPSVASKIAAMLVLAKKFFMDRVILNEVKIFLCDYIIMC